MMAKSVVGSSLVKTAIFGEDPNWGRILAAVGYAGVDVPVDNVDIMIGGLPVCWPLVLFPLMMKK